MPKSIAPKKLLIGELKPGMYVSSLDRPWIETPFLMQGFLITNEQDIEDIGKYCLFVYIDTAASISQAKDLAAAKGCNKETIRQLFPHRKLRSHSDSNSIDVELRKARPILETFTHTVSSIFNNAHQHAPIDIAEVRLAITPMVNSIIRNPDACIWLTRLRKSDDYTYQHAISASIWAVALGRHLGLPKADLQTLAIGVTLFDIGKMFLPSELIHKQGRLTDDEFTLIQSHVPLGLEKVIKSGGINNTIKDIIAYHHERYDGTGYPHRLKGDDIPIFARIAAIADCYDAITSTRPYAPAISPVTAIKKLYDWRGHAFQSELIEEFIQAIGIFPAGTLVELSSGEVGVVLAEYRTRRLRPKIIQLLDRDKHPLHTFKVIDLLTVTHDETGQALDIVESLEPGSYNLHLEDLNL
ncbi:HD-GYP domain-containing protein [Dasania marina]|uniref:HD-GYP domain-containing protein n=1 Tax=Dasania marina TaxID=471499 RepID=UPI000477A4BB|nr:HD-GYP domain-containing protein [Dasania marina]